HLPSEWGKMWRVSAMPAAGGGRWVEVPAERVAGWLAGFEEQHQVARTVSDGTTLRVEGADGDVAECHPPFPPLAGTRERPGPRAGAVGGARVGGGGGGRPGGGGGRPCGGGVGGRPAGGGAGRPPPRARPARQRRLVAAALRPPAGGTGAGGGQGGRGPGGRR